MDAASTTPPQTDRVLRAMTNDGALRVMTVRSTDTVRGVLAAQAPTIGQDHGGLGLTLGELVTAAVLYRETMAPTLRVQTFVKGAHESGTIIADSHPAGWSRGLIQRRADAGALDLGKGALLQLARTLPNGELHQGVVELGKNVSESFMVYMQASEQIVTMARVAVVFGETPGEVVTAGGYLVQLLPEAPDREGPVRVMAQRLEDDFADIGARLRATDADPSDLMDELLYAMPKTALGDSPISNGCDCSRARVMGSLATLGRAEIQELMDEGAPLEMNCDWCGTDYLVSLPELQGMLSPS